MNTLDSILKKFSLSSEKAEHFIELPNVSRYDLAKWLRELDFKKGVEVGVAAGDFSRVLCELNPQMEIWGVDPWQGYDGYRDFDQNKLNKYFSEAREKLRSFRKRCHLLRKFSADAIPDFEDESLDFVYVDANHVEPYVSQDLTDWSKKVRPGGIVAGHDYIKRVRDPWIVKEAVDTFVAKNDIKPLLILGLKEALPGLVREATRSWMWVKT